MTREIKFRHIKDDGSIEFELLNREESGGFVEQYTGLKDKNGKEIYESDVVKFKGIELTFIVKYSEPCAKFWAKCKNGLVEEFEDWSEEEIEVIGNIHENPDLLK